MYQAYLAVYHSIAYLPPTMAENHFSKLKKLLPEGNWRKDSERDPDWYNELVCDTLARRNITKDQFVELIDENYAKTPGEYYPKRNNKTWKENLAHRRDIRSPGQFSYDIYKGVLQEFNWFYRLVEEVIARIHPDVLQVTTNGNLPYFDHRRVTKAKDFTLIFGKQSIPVDVKVCPTDDFFTPKAEDLKACHEKGMYILGFWVPFNTDDDAKHVKFAFISPATCKAILDQEEVKVWYGKRGPINGGKPSVRLWSEHEKKAPAYKKYFCRYGWDCESLDIPI